MLELDFYARKRVHRLKYFTWVEQQQKPLQELNQQWNDYPEFWTSIHQQVEEIDDSSRRSTPKRGCLRRCERVARRPVILQERAVSRPSPRRQGR